MTGKLCQKHVSEIQLIAGMKKTVHHQNAQNVVLAIIPSTKYNIAIRPVISAEK